MPGVSPRFTTSACHTLIPVPTDTEPPLKLPNVMDPADQELGAPVPKLRVGTSHFNALTPKCAPPQVSTRCH